MKRAAIILVILAASSLLAQQPGTPNPPAAQSGTGQPGTTQPSAPPAQGKRPPQAKTQPEFDAYKTVVAITDPAGFEKAADDFAAKFPDSELRVVLYRSAMHLYQSANNGDKMLEMGRKVLKIDPDDPEALVGVAEVLAERTRDTDLDKEQRLDEAMKNAQRAVQTVDTDIVASAETPKERVDAYKAFLRSTAYSIMGTLALNKDKYAEASGYLQQSIDAYPAQPDPVAVLRLAVALDKQEKYEEALKVANRAVELTQEGSNAGTVARQERDRLVKLANAASPATAPKPPSDQPKN
jgi:tetratricopeptide (TPR) repeat protein